MSWKDRARRRLPRAATAPARNTDGAALTLRDEKILLTLVAQTQQLNDRLTRLEDRVEAGLRESAALPDEQDLIELRVHSAKLAAELSRVTLELRSEINELAKGRSDAPADDAAAGDETRADVDEPVIDLRAPAPPVVDHGRRRSSGWRPARPPQDPPDH